MTGEVLKAQARIIFNEVYAHEAVHDFKASDGWLTNFLGRNQLTSRRITTSGRELPADAIVKIREFITMSRQAFETVGAQRSQVFNMDETAIFFDYPPNYTYEKRGKKRVPVHTAGAERTRISAAFTGMI